MQSFNTDKFEHGYIPFYETFFSKMHNTKNVLEIGVFNGGSLNYFNNYFPNATIFGIDILDKTHYDTQNIKTFIVNQEDRDDLKKFLDKTNVDFDIILDDGGHTMKQQQTSFGFLFSKVKSGGLYIIEDLHTSRFQNYGTIFKSDLITTLDMCFNFKYTGNIVSNHINEEEKKYIETNVKSLTIWSINSEYNHSVTCVIEKL